MTPARTSSFPFDGDVDALTARLEAATQGGADVVLDPVFGIAATAASRG